ncbi:MAG: TonB family protein [Bacteroidetes bacterium]|nr:MAG: TonB family protein [Bacteroidota bacterium]
MFASPALLSFLAEASLWLLLGYLVYWLLLRRSSWFSFNRFFLLGTLGLSLAMPWVEVSSPLPPGPVAEVQAVFSTPVVTLTAEGVADSSGTSLPWYAWVYVSGLLLAIGRLGWELRGLARLLSRSLRRIPRPGYVEVLTGGHMATASFLHVLFWDETADLSPTEAAQMRAHELCHIRQRHSLDLILARLMGLLFWFHPVIYLLQRELRWVHEYLADRAALRHGSLPSYRHLLLAQVFGTKTGLLHAFSHPPIKQRWFMMTRKSPFFPMLLRATLALSLLAMLAIAMSCQPQGPAELAAQAVDAPFDMPPKPLNLAEVYQAIGYPEALAQAGQDGFVLVKILVDASGRYVRHEVAEASAPAFAEAVAPHLAELRFSPPRQGDKAVSTWVNLPFKFKLRPDGAEAGEATPKPLNLPEVYQAIAYPEGLKQAGEEGKVLVRILIDADGTYLRHEVVQASHHEFAEAVSEQLPNLRFEAPTEVAGKAAQVWINLPFAFRLG